MQKWYPELAEKYGLPVKPAQTISPHMFGSKTRKKTNYWLKGLPELQPTNIVEPEIRSYTYADGRVRTYSADFCMGKGSHSGKVRSKTYKGIAVAMAEQWGESDFTPVQLSFFEVIT